jgi:phospholipid/cholesterol/gamma-HCH transport system substrate-binding protein
MDTNVNYTVVGAFVILLISAIVFTIIWLSSGLSVVQYSEYLLYSQESVSGLNVDAQVEYNGVNVGEVKKISIDEVNPHLIKVLLKVESSTPITKGTTATLTSRGITGVVFIALKDTGNDLRPLVKREGQTYPVIPTTPSIFTRLDLALTRLSKSFETVSETFSELFDKENLHSIKGTLHSLDEITQNLAQNNQRLNAILLNTARASAKLTPFLLDTSNTIRILNTQTLPVTYELLSNLNAAAHSLSEISIELKQNPSMLIRGTAPLPLGPGETK